MDQGLMGTQREAFPGLKTLNERRLCKVRTFTLPRKTHHVLVCVSMSGCLMCVDVSDKRLWDNEWEGDCRVRWNYYRRGGDSLPEGRSIARKREASLIAVKPVGTGRLSPSISVTLMGSNTHDCILSTYMQHAYYAQTYWHILTHTHKLIQ